MAGRASLPKISTESIAEQVYLNVRTGIMDGRFKASERIVIDHISREMQVSLGPIREALARLASERLVQLENNKGYRVAPQLTPEDLRMWREARLILECDVCEIAAGLAAKRDIARLRSINNQIIKREFGPGAANVLAYMSINDAFHRQLVVITRNTVLLRMYDAMHYGPQVTRDQADEGVTDAQQIFVEHQAIIDAIEGRDAKAAAEAMRVHIIDGMTRAELRAVSHAQRT
ncbi:GntR family transcriptional regulator [Mesorhizobium sp. KR9-304]|uniref:GntR family transcriptional regulator n=1 Tax=Mesorhizobium sp. KR9-304 TaxID=3156614 RepID=UPI0032B327A5